jgi:hypothetical protein
MPLEPRRWTFGLTPLRVVILVALVLFGALTYAVLVTNEAMLVYTLDDPYIHLALAENLLRGSYGINLGEASSPSSSIVYPLLVALGLLAGLGDWTPLVLNFVALLGVLVTAERAARHALAPHLERPEVPAAAAAMIAVLASNGLGVAFTGMEHLLHVWVTLLVFLGLLRVESGDRTPAWLVATIALAPVVRYEALALTAASVLLLWLRDRRAAIFAAAGGGLVLGAHALWMLSMGLPALPSSVLRKLPIAQGITSLRPSSGDHIVSWLQGMLRALEKPTAGPLILVATISVLATLLPGMRRAGARLAAWTLGLVLAQVAFGRFSGYPRYEIYAVAVVMLAALLIFAPQFATLWRLRPAAAGMLLLLAVAAPCWRNLVFTWRVPAASSDIYSQQYQLHRFLTEFHREAVAVNDLGWASYRNDAYVLDLWGLGSEAARSAWASPDPAGAFETLVRDRAVPLAAIYEPWLAGARPSGWVPIGSLDLRLPLTVAGGQQITFFATEPARCEEMWRRLAAFAQMRHPPRSKVGLSAPSRCSEVVARRLPSVEIRPGQG